MRLDAMHLFGAMRLDAMHLFGADASRRKAPFQYEASRSILIGLTLFQNGPYEFKIFFLISVVSSIA